jgi:hypothetical protein
VEPYPTRIISFTIVQIIKQWKNERGSAQKKENKGEKRKRKNEGRKEMHINLVRKFLVQKSRERRGIDARII